MIITNIEPYAKGKGRYSVYVDGEFAFILYKGELSQYKLEVGVDIDSATYDDIVNKVLVLRAKKRGMNLLMKMDRTVCDVRAKLKEGGYPDKAVDEAIRYLESFRYLDDKRYASDYIYAKAPSMSQKMIRMKLRDKGIEQSIIDEAFHEYGEGNESNADLSLIEKLITKRIKGDIKDLTYQDKQKLFAYLYSKGFKISDIEQVYNYLT